LAVSCADKGAEGIVCRASGGMTVTVCWKTTSETGDCGLIFNPADTCKCKFSFHSQLSNTRQKPETYSYLVLIYFIRKTLG